MTAEEKQQMDAWREHSDKQKRRRALKRIQQLATQHGLTVTIEGGGK